MRKQRGDWRSADAPGARASIALLALGAVIVAAMAWQALEGARSREAAVERLVADYSTVATWSFRRFADANLESGLEHLMHPIHPPEDGRLGHGGAAALLAAHRGGDHAMCSFGGTEDVRGALHFRMRTRVGAPEVAGAMPPGIAPEELTALLAHLARTTYRPGWTSALALVPGGGTVHPVSYHVRRIGPDTLVWALPFATEGLRTLLRQATSDNDLLPPSLTGPLAGGELLRLGVWDGAGRLVWGSGTQPDFASQIPRLDLGERWGGLVLAAMTLPEAAPRLAIGGLPGSRVPVTLALLLLATGLLVVAVAQSRRVHQIARLRSDFVSSVSHELRTPLALQRVSIDTLRLGRARDRATRERALANVDREASRLTHLVDNLLRFSRAEVGKTNLHPEHVALAPLLENAAAGFAELVDPRDVEVRTEFDPGLRAAVDPEALRRVVLNLLENAVKYGPDGQTVTVGLRREGARAVITVDDQGPGVPDAERSLVWQPFRRGEEAVCSATAGSGIGLSVVREIVEAHGGGVRILDAPAGGARFEVWVPLAPASKPAAQGRTAETERRAVHA